MGDVCILQRFLSYFRQYIPDFSRIAKPLCDPLALRRSENSGHVQNRKSEDSAPFAQPSCFQSPVHKSCAVSGKHGFCEQIVLSKFDGGSDFI